MGVDFAEILLSTVINKKQISLTKINYHLIKLLN